MVCDFDTCERTDLVVTHGLCRGHYQQKKAGKPLSELIDKSSPLNRDPKGRKLCKKCKKWKAEEKFGSSARSVDGLSTYCKECKAFAEGVRRFGRAWIDREFTLLSQGGSCAACGTTDPGRRGWVIDHDHSCCDGNFSCGRCVRGILCSPCNMALGAVRDNPERLRRLANYLERTTK